ncbi:MAG: hypothetical protein A4E65_02836 [Syntrophorhabdus sp. PtaU1.Bin153]|nr:MAG: hypothetical protein A4E65_02836 [Syntrophorhabdus sp. PtaU1.Bin153]
MTENAYVCYCDVLGFTSRFISGYLSNRYEQMIEMVKAIEDRDITIYLLSDSIVVISEDFVKFRAITQELYTWGILHDFWLRGAITRGNVTRGEVRTINEPNRFIVPFLGEGYLRAYTLETTLNISGMMIDDAFFESDDSNPGFRKNIDYTIYEEYVPKRGYEGKKRLLLAKEHSLRPVLDTMRFEQMLKSHIEDVDKYLNTFCFYIEYLLEHANPQNVALFVEKLMGEFEGQGKRILIPSKVVIIFIAVIEGLLSRYRSPDGSRQCDAGELEQLVNRVIDGLRTEGYLVPFIDGLLDFDKRRHTTLYKEINSLRSL